MTQIINDFLEYVKKNEVYLLEVNKVLTKDIHGQSNETLKLYGSEVLAHRARVVICLAKFNQDLDIATMDLLPDKTKSMSEIERKARVEKSVAAIRYWRDICKGLTDTIDKRVSFIQTVLSYEKSHMGNLGSEVA